jgi:hypothetical protein
MPIAKGYSRVSQTFFDCASSAERKFQRATLANGADHPAAGHPGGDEKLDGMSLAPG